MEKKKNDNVFTLEEVHKKYYLSLISLRES